MRTWGKSSAQVFSELDPRLQTVLSRVLLEVADISLIEGHRNEIRQESMVATGKSQAPWPTSKHNTLPSLAVDFAPYPYPKKEVELWAALAYVAGAAVQIGKQEGITIRWGGDWNRNGDLTDNNFDDLFHLEVLD